MQDINVNMDSKNLMELFQIECNESTNFVIF
jgi:hypothetical protein